MGQTLDDALGILNGVVGDYLARTGNGLATEMGLVHDGRALPVTRSSLAEAHPDATSRVVVLVHGSSCTESVWRYPDGRDYGALLDEEHGFTPLYLRYNSGLAIADNGAEFCALLDALLAAYPVDIREILLLGYSMGGLVIRSACHVAAVQEAAWLPLVRQCIYVGTPHLGAPLERVGRLVAGVLRQVPDPYAQLAADIADLRSDGVKDLGNADLRHEDRAARGLLALRNPRHPVPLLTSMRHRFVAGALKLDPRIALLLGDALVPVPSGTHGRVGSADALREPPVDVRICEGSHLSLAHDPRVYDHITAWCRELA